MRILFFLCSFYIAASMAATDPFAEVALVTNSLSWPYNNKTFGNDSFIAGKVEEGDSDSLLLQKLQQQKYFNFPPNFKFGVAYSAYQYEGNRYQPNFSHPDGIGWSIWDVFSRPGSWLNPLDNNISKKEPTQSYTQANGEQAIEGYSSSYYLKDIKLAKRLGVKVIRLSISWPRLFPHAGMKEPDAKALKHYQTVLRHLKEQGFEVWVTLYHWDLPAWLYNYGDKKRANQLITYGWLDYRPANKNTTLQEYQKYVDACFKSFGRYTPYFSTFNEPLTFTNSGLYLGNHAPGQAGWSLLRRLNPKIYGHNRKENLQRLNYLQSATIIKAHFMAYKTFAKYRSQIEAANHQKAMLGIVVNSDWAEPYRIIANKDKQLAYHPDDIAAAKRNMDFMLGWWLEPIMYGHWPQSMQKLVGNRLPNFNADPSCLDDEGRAVVCRGANQEKLSHYISRGGALDNISLNHYTSYFVMDSEYAKKAYLARKLSADQYGVDPLHISPGWSSDQQTFVTVFRQQKYGDWGGFPKNSPARRYIIGKAGAQPWLRHHYVGYIKLLEYIQNNYLKQGFTKQGKAFNKLEIYLTENGTSLLGESQKRGRDCLQDKERIDFIRGNLAAVWQAMQEGIAVKMYTYWSLADNFEWAEGYDSRFGLVWIDYAHHYKRLVKASYRYYQQVIAEGRIY